MKKEKIQERTIKSKNNTIVNVPKKQTNVNKKQTVEKEER